MNLRNKVDHQLINRAEASRMLGISEKTLKRHYEGKGLATYKVGNGYRFKRAEIIDFIKRLQINK